MFGHLLFQLADVYPLQGWKAPVIKPYVPPTLQVKPPQLTLGWRLSIEGG